MGSVDQDTQSLHPLCQISTPVGMLGYGFDEAELDNALENLSSASIPRAIILDSGSTDSGPSKLATGKTTVPHSSYKKDLTKLVNMVLKYQVPLLISSAGGDGSNAHVDELSGIVQEILSSRSKKLNVLAIYSEIPRDVVLERLGDGEIEGCGPAVPKLTAEAVAETPTIVAQMGPEPFLDAMIANPAFDIIIGGRAYDPAPYIAYSVYQALKGASQSITSVDRTVLGGISHMAKIMECGGLCATPKSRGALATVFTNGTFDIRPTDPKAKCTPLSVAAHTLYEKTQPDILYGPGGWIDLTKTKYSQLEDGVTTRVQGATFTFSTEVDLPYTVKLEGAKSSGFRTIFIGSFSDPILIPQLSNFLENGREYCKRDYPLANRKWELDWHLTGLENYNPADVSSVLPKKVFIVAEALAETQELASDVAHALRIFCTHGPYPGQKATSGNFAMGIGGKLEIPTGECAEFTMYHLMKTRSGEEGARSIDTVSEDRHPKPLFTWRKLFTSGASIASTPLQTTSPFQIQAAKATNTATSKIEIPTLAGTLRNIAKVIRSKNAGPFEVTMDVVFDDVRLYNEVKSSELLDAETISRIFSVRKEDIIWCGFFDQALAFKVTLPRTRKGVPMCSGGFMEDDVHGSQQYAPLMELELNDKLARSLEALRL